MKKILIFVLFLLCANSLFARTKVDKGIFVGLNLANITGDWHENSNLKAGVTAGLYFSFNMTDKFKMRPEIYFSTKGSKNKFPVEQDPDEPKYNESYGYIELPILISYTLIDHNRFGFELMGGPVISYLVEAKWELFLSDNQSAEIEVDKSTKKADFGALIGANFNFKISGQTIFIGARYIHGFSNINDSDQKLEMQNKVLTVIAGFSL